MSDRSSTRRRFRRIFVEQLEDRSLLAATITVNSVLDANARDSVLTLREAILISNQSLAVASLTAAEQLQIAGTPTSADADTIAFNIPGSGVHTISPTAALPTITDAVIINGYTQPGAGENSSATGFNGTLLIELNGSGAGVASSGLTAAAGGSTIKGLVINRFSNSGLLLLGGGGNHIEGNLIGTSPSGLTAAGNETNGITLDSGSNNNTIGGSVPAARNVISGSLFGAGIEISTAGNIVAGNFVGVNALGTAALANQYGVTLFGGTGNVIGTNGDGVNDAAESNVISGNRGSGVAILSTVQSTPSQNIVAGNYIGTNAAGDVIGNELYGVMTSVTNNTIGPGNVIAFNGSRFSGPGVILLSGTALNTAILGNSIFSNVGLGIDLHGDGVTPNDAGDADSGDNNLQNFPVISSATVDGTTVRVQYAVPSATANSTYPFRVEFFKADADGQEGQTFLGFDTYTAAQAGTGKTIFFTSAAAVAAGDKLVATATDGQGNTSEFSASVTAAAPPCSMVVINTNDTGAGSLREAITCANSISNIDRTGDGTVDPDPITFAISANDPRHFYYRNDAQNGGLENITATTANDDSTISNIDPDWRHSWYSIQVSTALPTITEAVGINGYSQAGALANSNGVGLVNNAVLKVELTEASSSKGTSLSGLSVTGGASSIRGLAINGFDEHGIQIGSDGNTVGGNFIGTDISGTVDEGNGGDGVNIAARNSNLVGGTVVSERNLIGNNAGSGIALIGGASNNSVQGNFIFRNSSGTVYSTTTGAGILIDNSQQNMVGGTTAEARNLISGNAQAVLIRSGAHDNTVQGNFIGSDVTGMRTFANELGVVIQDAHDNLIGGAGPSARNLISGNVDSGVLILGTTSPSTTFNNAVKGNYIGPNVTGEAPLKTIFFGYVDAAVRIAGAFNNIIGGPEPGAGNVISGNNSVGLMIESPFSTGNSVQGNYIGLSASGALAMGNSQFGVAIVDAGNNVVGGAGTARNVISANGHAGLSYDGVYLQSDAPGAASGNLIQGNYIGTDPTGTQNRGNAGSGIYVNAAASTQIRDNLISANGQSGISLGGPGTVITGNTIGASVDGVSPLANSLDGVEVGSANNLIGGTDSGSRNVIAFNGRVGVFVSGSSSTGNSTLGNSIFSNGQLGIDLTKSADFSPDGLTANDTGDSDEGSNRLQNFPEINSATSIGGTVTVQYKVPSTTANSAYPLRVEFFKADGDGQEGQTFLGFDTYVSAEAAMTKSFVLGTLVKLTAGDKIVGTATDNTGNTSEFSASQVVQILNSPPEIFSNGGGDTANVSIPENTTAVADVDATDPDIGQTLTYSILGGSDASSFTIVPSSGVLTFATAPNFEGPTDSDLNNVFQVVIGVSDGFESDSQTLSVTVTDVNEPPAAEDDGYETSEDSSLAIVVPGLLVNDTDSDHGDTKSVVGVNGLEANVGVQIFLTSGALLKVNSDGSYQYDPNRAFEFLGAGESENDYFSYTMADSQGATSSAVVTIRIDGANDAPVAGDDGFAVDEDTFLSVGAGKLIANDVDVDGDKLMLAVKSQPRNGQLVLRMDGSFTYLPEKDFNGPDSFTYQLSDGQATSNVATVTISVTAVNDRPVVLLGGDVYVDEGTAFSSGGSFSDPDGVGSGSSDSWTASVDYGDGSRETLSLSAEKKFSLGHAYGDNGDYRVTVVVEDSGHLEGTASLVAHAKNVPPQQLTWAGPFQGLLGNAIGFAGAFTDPGFADTETASVDWGDGVITGAAVTGSRGAFTVQASHTFATSGFHPVTVTVKDDDGGTASKTATVGLVGAVLQGGVLEITGSEQRDDLKLTAVNQTLVVSGSLSAMSISQSFPLASVQSIMAQLYAGDDALAVDAKIKQALLVNAGAGNDVVQAGSGPAVVIGGAGQDSLNGGSKSDLLIAGTTAYDDHQVALAAILEEWSSTRNLNARSKNLRTGTGPILQRTGITLVMGKTVFNDTSVDTLIGNGDFDWFMLDTNKDKLKFATRGELTN